MIKRFVILLVLLTAAIVSHGEIAEKIAIIVNNRAVTLYEVKRIFNARAAELYQKYSGDELNRKLDQLKKQVIQEKTEELLLLEKAALQGIEVTDEQMDVFVQNLMQENNIDNIDQFRNALMQSTGMTLEEFKKVQKTQMTARQVVQKLVINKIMVDEAQVKAYYQDHIADYQTPFTYDIQEIVIFEDPDDPAAAGRRITECRDAIRNGTLSFNDAVQKYSESGSKEYNGELHHIKKGELNEKLEQAALALKPGEMSDPIILTRSYHLIKLLSVHEPQPIPFDDVKQEIEQKLREPQIQAAIKAFIEDLRGSFYVRVEVKPEDL